MLSNSEIGETLVLTVYRNGETFEMEIEEAASAALSMIREIVFGVGFVLTLPLLFGLDGVLYSMPATE